jgi:hypothetical protein
MGDFYKKEFGGDLLSHQVALAVPSAQRSLTAVIGTGTGVTSSLLPPKIEVSVPAGSLIRPEGSDLGLPAARRQFCMPTTKRVADIRSLNWITVFFHPPFISKT